MDTGCKQDICFFQYCKKNPFSKCQFAHFLTESDNYNFKNKKELLLTAFKIMQDSKDPDELICADSLSLNASNIDQYSGKTLSLTLRCKPC